ncbi:MAG: septum formation inhibitor Maf [Deltaproteobacteria bacterium]|nr:septum formation inhibitor Maf [Deltaproteobacteria bacterium]
MSSCPLILASASPRRRELLSSVGIRFSVVPGNAPEEEIPGETPEEHVIRLSIDKARDVAFSSRVEGRWFLGSDTIVLRDEDILGKPGDAEEAFAMLQSLSGRAHQVVSGYALFDREKGEVKSGAVKTKVNFKELTREEIEGYIATGEPFDKAGAYAIQGIGAFMVKNIEGSYTNVVGLPLCEVVELLEKAGAAQLFSWEKE